MVRVVAACEGVTPIAIVVARASAAVTAAPRVILFIYYILYL
jgi:hypothetical protein